MKIFIRLIALLAAVAIVGLSVGIAYAWSRGERFYAVQSDSMWPTISRGDLVVDSPVTPSSGFRLGDVITFNPTPGYTATHRIAAIDSSGIRTKGDANLTNDVSVIQPSQIIGRVWAVVPFAGYLAVFLQQPLGLLSVLLVIITFWFGWEMLRRRPDSVLLGAPEQADSVEPPASDAQPVRMPDSSYAVQPGGVALAPAAVMPAVDARPPAGQSGLRQAIGIGAAVIGLTLVARAIWSSRQDDDNGRGGIQ